MKGGRTLARLSGHRACLLLMLKNYPFEAYNAKLAIFVSCFLQDK